MDALEQVRGVVDMHDTHVPSRAQAVLENRRAQRILVDYGNAQIPAQRSSMSRWSLSSTWRTRDIFAWDRLGSRAGVWFLASRLAELTWFGGYLYKRRNCSFRCSSSLI